MAERKTMGDALALDADKLAFIRGGAAKATKTVNLASPSDVEKPPVLAAAEPPAPAGLRVRRRIRPRGRREARETATEPARVSETPFVEQLLVPLTTRLRPETADALRRAHLEQRLRRQKPDTVQDIVQQAVSSYLQKLGFPNQP